MHSRAAEIERKDSGFFVEDGDDLGAGRQQCRECFKYWRELCARSDGLPHRSMIEPYEIPRLLPNFQLVDLFDQGVMKPRYRLAGAVVRELAGRPIMGIYFSDIYDADTYRLTLALYARLVERRLPYYLQARVMFPGRDFITVERLMLPFGDANGDVATIGGVSVVLDGRA